MPTLIGFAILTGLAGLLGLAVGAVFLRPRRMFLVVALVQVAIFAWLAIASHRSAKACQVVLDTRHDYLLIDNPDGDHTVRIDELPGIDGLRVEAGYRDRSSPPTRDTMKLLHWRVNGKPADLQDSGFGVCLMDLESEEWGRGKFMRLDITYHVSEKSKPHLDGLVLRATAPRMAIKGAFVFLDVNRILALILGIGSIVGVVGVASQFIRARSKRIAEPRP